LKIRYLWIVVAVAVVLVITILIEKSGLLDGTQQPALEIPAVVTDKYANLRVCDTTQMDYSGPLIPDQSTNNVENNSIDVNTDKKVSERAGSSRPGFGISSPTDPEHWAQLLGSGWYIDWSMRAAPSQDNLDHWQMIRVHEDCISPSPQVIQKAASQFSGQVWIIGNEPDVIWQDNVTASTYAAVYHDLQEMIKSSDPTALIAVGGVSQSTPLRLQYLDQVLTTYQYLYNEPMPVDWWTVHGYVLREEKDSWGVDIPPGIDINQGELREVKDHARIDLFEIQIRSFRTWMAENGYQNTPLALTEFGILMPNSYGFPEDEIANYLEQTFSWLTSASDETTGYPDDEYRLVQKWAWFSISDPTYSSSNLGDISNGNLTLVGKKFHDVVSSMVP
jgi:hypothetical protein